MRILQINPIVGHSSTGRAVSELDRYFRQQGHESFVAAMSGYGVDNIYFIGSSFDRKVHASLSRITGLEAHFSTGATKKLIKYIENIKPDVIRLGIAHSNYINIFMLLDYIAKKDIPTCLVLNDCWYFTGKCMHFTTNKCYKWKESCQGCKYYPKFSLNNKQDDFNKNSVTKVLPTLFFNNSQYMLKKKKEYLEKIPRLGVVGVSDWLTRTAKESILKSAKIIKRIYNWIDLKEFYPRENREEIKEKYNLKGKYIILGVASVWIESKGLSSWLKLAEEIDEDSRVVLVGTLEGQNFPERFFHINQTRDVQELAEIYSMADVFMTFSMEETFGKASAEALACGTPVICYNSTANPELVGEGCGKVVPVGDFNSILSALNEIKQKPKSFYKDNCVNYAQNNFKFENSAQEYLNVFRELIEIQ